MYKRYFKIAREDLGLLIVATLTGGIAGISSGFGVPYFVQEVFRKIFEDSGTRYSLNYLIFISSLLPAIFVLRGISSYINQYILQKVAQNILMKVRAALFDKIQTLPIAWFEKRQSGDLMAKLVGDTLQVQEGIHLVTKDGFVQPFTFAAGFGFLTYLSIQQQEIGFILLMLILAPLIIVPVSFIGRNLRRRSRDLQETLSRLTEVLAENLRAVIEVRAFSLRDRETERFQKQLTTYNRFALKIAKYYHITQPLMEIIAVTMVSLAFIYSYEKQITFSTFASLGAALYFTVDAVKALVKMLNGVQRVSGAFVRIDQVLSEIADVAEPENPLQPDHVEGAVTFENVVFSYDDHPALTDINVHIPAHTVCALVGPSGAGKSTFAKLIPRFYDPDSGRILIDQTDIRDLTLDGLRQHIAFVPQLPVLFNGTVADNILLARPGATRQEVIAAARAAYADSFVSLMEKGYDTPVGENAVRLSGGQRQRLALARAFLKNAPILILDEATSALDSESEQKIQLALTEFSRNRTVFIIAHRFSTIRMANTVMLFDEGKIIAQGTYDQLLQHPLFARLAETQNIT